MHSLKKYISIFLYALITISFGFVYLWTCFYKYNSFMLIIRTLVTVAISILVWFGLKKVNHFLEKYAKWIVGGFLVAMFVLQIVFGYFLEITPNWDFRSIYQGAIDWVETGSFENFNDYYYMYPNNLGPMTFLMVCFRMAHLFGITDYYMVGTVVNAILNICMMLVVFLICKRLLSVRAGIFSLFIFAVSLPSYFCASVFYTDVLSMIFPVLFFYLYLRLKDEGKTVKKIIYAILMGLVIFVGIEIKFTVVIVGIALLIEAILNANKKNLIIGVSTVFLILIIGFFTFDSVIYSGHLDKSTADTRNFPALHWIMMGLQGNGGFSLNDENFTKSFSNTDERNQALKDEISHRIDNLGASGIFRLIMDKSTKCFGDGTYELAAFFYHGMAKDTVLNDYVVGSGSHYSQYQIFCTGIFLGFLLLLVIGTFGKCMACTGKKEIDTSFLIPGLSVLGILLFLLMWETSARYITNYIPMIYIGAVIGMSEISKMLEGENEPVKEN